MHIKFKLLGESIGTRAVASSIRFDIIQALLKNEEVVFDFDGVDVVANSFADECFAKLLDDFSFQFIKEKTKFINADSFVTMIIMKAINDKIRKLNQEKTLINS